MFCRLTYSCIQFLQRTTPPLSKIYKKLNQTGLVNCIKKVDDCPLKIIEIKK